MNHATHPLPAEMIGRSTRTLTPEQRSALEESDCGKCGKAASDARHVLTVDRAGRILGVEYVACWNASVEETRRRRAAELAARPGCEACGQRPVTWTLRGSDGPVGVCGACRRRVNQRIRRLLLFGVPDATRAQILAAAREKVPA